jgi:hypothetical protein
VAAFAAEAEAAVAAAVAVVPGASAGHTVRCRAAFLAAVPGCT